MTDPLQDETLWLGSLGAARRARFLASLSHNLTVAARVLCHADASPEQALEWVRLLNEAQHRVTSYLSHHHAGDEDPGWIPVVVESVLSSPEAVVLHQARQAWARSKAIAVRSHVH